MRRCLMIGALLVAWLSAWAQVQLPAGKEIYIPKRWRGMDLQDPESEWSYHRMACTENIAIFWQKGFGDDLSNPPALEGHPMQVDLPNLMEKLEHFYVFYRDTLKFVKPGSKSERYRMMVMLNYSLEGTAYGGDYDGVVGALWVAPNRIQDERLNCMAHELGHSFQMQMMADGDCTSLGDGCSFLEMVSQWMLWQVNPLWVEDEEFHWEAFTRLAHKAFLHLDNIYNSPYVLEYWSMKHGVEFIGELMRQGLKGEDAAMTYMRLKGLSVEAFSDEMFDAYRHFVDWDLERVWQPMRPYANRWEAPSFVDAGGGWQRIAAGNCPENYGFNVVSLPLPKPGETVEVSFRGEAGMEGYVSLQPEEAGWRYGLVAVTEEGKPVYGEAASAAEGTVRYTATDALPACLWLVVMGAPQVYHADAFAMLPEVSAPAPDGEWGTVGPPEETPEAELPDMERRPDAQWPYSIKVTVHNTSE
ncbi:MAG: DUF6055 domain-containing protein [Prevotellaceae bacterium]|nr:DUF6055 domain-containing protein [Prevotellaceae bacterium]